jgi:hypothetical protein
MRLELVGLSKTLRISERFAGVLSMKSFCEFL